MTTQAQAVIQLPATGRAGPPISGTFVAGVQMQDTSGLIWECVVGGTPGTWISAAVAATLAQRVYCR